MKFKYDVVDITTINAIINFIISIYHVNLKSRNGPMLGRTSKNLEKFLRKFARNLQLSYENNTRYCIIHALATDGHNIKQQARIDLLKRASNWRVLKLFGELLSMFEINMSVSRTKVMSSGGKGSNLG